MKKFFKGKIFMLLAIFMLPLLALTACDETNYFRVTVTVNDTTKAAGADDPGFTTTVTGMVEGEDPAELLDYDFDRAPGEDAGDYTVTPVGDAVQGNYNVVYVPGTLTINSNSPSDSGGSSTPTTYAVTVNYVDDEGNTLQPPRLPTRLRLPRLLPPPPVSSLTTTRCLWPPARRVSR